MTDTETFIVDTALEFGAIGPQPVCVVGTVKECSISVTCLRSEIRSVVMFILAQDNSTTLAVDITHRLKPAVSLTLQELLEKRYREFKAHSEREPDFDWEVGVG